MFKLNETVLVSNLVAALDNENGRFLITAPTGEALEVRIEGGYVQIEREAYFPSARRNDLLWAVVKLRELTETQSKAEEQGEVSL
jgi:hypothetical protein